MDTQWNILVKNPGKEVRSCSILNSQRSVLYPSMALMYVVSNCVFSGIFYTTCSQALYLFKHLLTPQMMNCAQESMHEYLLLNELNELAGENVTIKASRNYLPALLTREGKNSIKYMRPHQLCSFGVFFQFSLVLFSGTSHTMENHSTITDQHLVYCCLTNHSKM